MYEKLQFKYNCIRNHVQGTVILYKEYRTGTKRSGNIVHGTIVFRGTIATGTFVQGTIAPT